MIATSPPDMNEITLSAFLIYRYKVSNVNANRPVDPHPQMNTRLPYWNVSLTELYMASIYGSDLIKTSNTPRSNYFIR